MSEELQHYVDSGVITAAQAEILTQLQPGCYCTHRSWGFGQVAGWELAANKLIIDFEEKKAHPMQLAYGADTLTPLANTHILVRVFEDPDTIKKESNKDPIGLMSAVLQDHGGKATVDQISAILVPRVFEMGSFKKWFTGVKKKLKADGHFLVPTKKSEPIEFQESKVEPHHRVLQAFQQTRHPKEQVAYLNEGLKLIENFLKDPESLETFLGEIAEAADRAGGMHLGKAVELLLGHDHIASCHEEETPVEGGNQETSQAESPLVSERLQRLHELLADSSHRLEEIFEELPTTKYRSLLQHLPHIFEQHWKKLLTDLLASADPRFIAEVFHLFKTKEEKEFFYRWMGEAIEHRAVSTDFLKWVCEQRDESFAPFLNYELFDAILASLEREMHAERKKGSRLYDLLLKDKELVAKLLAQTEKEHVRTALRKVMMSPVFQDIDRRSLLARLLKLHPDLESMIVGEEEDEEAIPSSKLIVSWPSLERRKEEYEHLVTRLIPQNTKDISIARSYGDLRENFEFKSAKEQQTVLLRQKAELEAMLLQARGTNFENPDTSIVSIGTTVTLESTKDGHQEIFSILGAWDGSPEKGWVSYQAGIGRVLLGHRVGDTVYLPIEEGKKEMSILKILPFEEIDQLT